MITENHYDGEGDNKEEEYDADTIHYDDGATDTGTDTGSSTTDETRRPSPRAAVPLEQSLTSSCQEWGSTVWVNPAKQKVWQ
jgi:hypothetical protein